ncbi:MAG: hypothetical protein ACPLTR_06645 [Thermacetogeniaceae bacterium]
MISLAEIREQPAWRQLRSDLESGRVAHAYIFAGRAPLEKGAAAEFFAKSLLCLSEEGEACGRCPSCAAWERGTHPDFHSMEPQGGSIKLEQIKAWQPFFSYHPHLGRRQVFLIERPELMTPEAANSLLKVLEEPLPDTVFLLKTEDERALLPTVVSRCRVVFFRQEGQEFGRASADEEKEEFVRLVLSGSSAELLRFLRSSKLDRSGGREALSALLDELESAYRAERERMAVGGEADRGLNILGCLEIILKGLRLLDENANVQLALASTLYKVQRRLRGQAQPKRG